MKRSELRENIFKLLFVHEFNSVDEMPEQMELYFDGDEVVKEKDQSYIQNKYKKIAEKSQELDSLINEASSGWKTGRMGKVDLSILRLAVYEMLYDEDVPVKVAINEAVELAKRFGQDASASFINGILGSIAKSQSKES